MDVETADMAHSGRSVEYLNGYEAGYDAALSAILDKAKARQALACALAYVRWSAFGECRTPGWDGPPPQAYEVDALLAYALVRIEAR